LLSELYRFRALTWALARRDLLARYRGTALGFGWSLLHPLLYLGAYALVFGRVAPIGVERYPAFLFAGLLPWSWFSSCLLIGSTSILADAPLVKRAAFPSSIPAFVVSIATGANFLLALPVLFLVLALTGTRPNVAALAIPLLVVLQFLLQLGLATALSALTVRFRDVAQLAQASMPLLFILTPVVYPAALVSTRLPGAAATVALWANPAALIARSWQRVLYEGAFPEALVLLALAAHAAVALALGHVVLEKLRDRIPEEL
jgi:ABC-type polysaccharide/polyol phosphate export permease